MTRDSYKPSRKMINIYEIYLTVSVIIYLACISPIIIATISLPEGPIIAAILIIPLIAITVFTLYWIHRFYDSISYTLTDNEIIVARGVWWRKNSIVPYHRVTNIDIVQGPISRFFGVATLKVQTAGYSSPQTPAEAQLIYVENYDSLKKSILERIRKARVKEPEEADKSELKLIIEELKNISKLLENISNKISKT